jgi:hypothetical protein
MRLREFLTLPVSIVGPMPSQLQDGQLIDAVPLMANFNYIVSQVNANVPPLIPSTAGLPVYVPIGGVGGTANAITLSPTIPATTYTNGQIYLFQPANTNTGSVTVAVSGLPPVQLLSGYSGLNLTGLELRSLVPAEIVYTNGAFFLLNIQSFGQSYTPTIAFGGAAVGVTYSLQTGTYIKNGGFLTFAVDLTLSNKGSSTGAAAIAMPPYPASTWTIKSAIPLIASNVTFASGYLAGIFSTLTNTLTLVNVTSAGTYTTLTDTAFSNTSEIIVTGSYPC